LPPLPQPKPDRWITSPGLDEDAVQAHRSNVGVLHPTPKIPRLTQPPLATPLCVTRRRCDPAWQKHR